MADARDYAWLVSDAAAPYLRDASQATDSVLSQVSALRKKLSPERAHLIVEQAELRRRARAKFPVADRMFFTRVALEQATDLAIAHYKAERLPTGGALLDLCCGIGGDLIALAERAPTCGVDREPRIAILARANVRLVERAGKSHVVCGDEHSVAVAQFAAWHADPDRRGDGKRTVRIERYSPPLSSLDRMLAANENAAIKLAPAADASEAWRDRAEHEWISRRRECRQQVAWFGALAQHAGRRRATIVNDSGVAVRSLIQTDLQPAATISDVSAFIFDPDPAILAADLLDVLAAEHSLHRITPGVAYITGESPIDDPALACFEVLEVMNYHEVRLKKALHARGVGQVEVKKRGVEIDPLKLQKSLRGPGDEAAVVLLTRVSQSTVAIIARRYEPTAEAPQSS